VAWAHPAEWSPATVVFITLVVLVVLIFLLNWSFAHAISWLYTTMSELRIEGGRRAAGRRRAVVPKRAPPTRSRWPTRSRCPCQREIWVSRGVGVQPRKTESAGGSSGPPPGWELVGEDDDEKARSVESPTTSRSLVRRPHLRRLREQGQVEPAEPESWSMNMEDRIYEVVIPWRTWSSSRTARRSWSRRRSSPATC